MKKLPRRPLLKRRSRILVVDDHPVVREGLALRIGREPDLAICCTAETAQQALAQIESGQADLAIVDISLGDSNGIELIKDIRACQPKLPVLVLSMHEESLYAQRALRAGAKGYIMKQEPMEKLLKAIRKVLAGGIYLSDPLTRQMINSAISGGPASIPSPIGRLSDRELEVFQLIGRGRTTHQIADALHLSMKTVSSHRESIKLKMELSNSAELVRNAIRWVQDNRAD